MFLGLVQADVWCLPAYFYTSLEGTTVVLVMAELLVSDVLCDVGLWMTGFDSDVDLENLG